MNREAWAFRRLLSNVTPVADFRSDTPLHLSEVSEWRSTAKAGYSRTPTVWQIPESAAADLASAPRRLQHTVLIISSLARAFTLVIPLKTLAAA